MSEDGTGAPPARVRGRFAPGRSGNPDGGARRARADIAPAAPPGGGGGRRARLDADWVNFFTGQGVLGRDKRMGAHFNVTPLSFDQLMHLWLGDDLAARAVELIPKEALRQGYDITVSDSQEDTDEDTDGLDPSEASAEITDELERLGADDAIEIAASYERGYGGGAILIGANDGQSDLTQPLNLKAVRSLDFLNPLEARECMPIYAYADPRAPKYGQPEIYRIITRSVLPSRQGFSAQTMEIHESRLLIFPGIRVSRFQPLTARAGWGEAVLTRIYRVLRDFNAAYANTGVLINDFSQAVVKIAGLWEALAQDAGAFNQRLEAMERGRSTVNAIAIDAGDSYERQQTPVTGLSDLLERFGVRLAAACDMPLTLLFGTSPAGMNATGESDIRSFYDRVASYQKRKILPKLRQICQILFRTIGSRREPENWSIKFRPLWQESEKDSAAAFLARTQADVALVTASIASPEEIAKAHWGKGEYDPNITIDFAAREAQEAAAAAPVTQADLAAMQVPPDDYQPPPGAGTAQAQPEVTPPGKPAAPDRNTPPVRTIAAEDAADAPHARRRDYDPDQPRDADGKWGSGGAGTDPGRAPDDRAAAAVKDPAFTAPNRDRLIAAGDRVRANYPRDQRATDAVHEEAQKEIRAEAGRILREQAIVGSDPRMQGELERLRGEMPAPRAGEEAAKDHDVLMERVTERREELAQHDEARAAGLVPKVPDEALKTYQAAEAKQNPALDEAHAAVDAASQKALEALGRYGAHAEEGALDDLPVSHEELAAEYAEAADRLGGKGQLSAAGEFVDPHDAWSSASPSRDRYGEIAEREHAAPAEIDIPDHFRDEESGEIKSRWEPDPEWEPEHVTREEADRLNFEDRDDGGRTKVGPWDLERFTEGEAAGRIDPNGDFNDFDKRGHVSDPSGHDAAKVAAWNAAADADRAEYERAASKWNAEEKVHDAADKAEFARVHAEIKAHEEAKHQAADDAQRAFEELHAKQAAALQAAKVAETQLGKSRDAAQTEISEEDFDPEEHAHDRIVAHPALAGAPVDDEGLFADDAHDRLYKAAQGAFAEDVEKAREPRATLGSRYGEQTRGALSAALGSTAAVIKELSKVTGRAPAITKPKSSRKRAAE